MVDDCGGGFEDETRVEKYCRWTEKWRAKKVQGIKNVYGKTGAKTRGWFPIIPL
jgi:hypothetical protein